VNVGFNRQGSMSLLLRGGSSNADAPESVNNRLLLSQLREMDVVLQRVHPCFAPARSSFSAWDTAPVVEALRKIHSSALALHTEVVARCELPKEARAVLPPRASALLPKEVLTELDAASAAEPAALEVAAGKAAARLVQALRIAEADPAAAFELLERVQRAAEVWAAKAQASGAEVSEIGSGSPAAAARPPPPDTADTGGRAQPPSPDGPKRTGAPSLFSLKLARPSRAKVARQCGMAAAARRLAFEIRRAQPTLGLTSCEMAKVGANSQVPRKRKPQGLPPTHKRAHPRGSPLKL
jgi:hypothetical protein